MSALVPSIGLKRATWDYVTLVPPPEIVGSVRNFGLPEHAPLELGASFRVHRRGLGGGLGSGVGERCCWICLVEAVPRVTFVLPLQRRMSERAL